VPKFLSTRGQPTLGIALCQRCQRKRRQADLIEDGNIRQFWVCRDNRGCRDVFDPFREPAPPPDKLTLPFVRPDVPLTIPEATADQLPLQPPSQED
jgi:hypothetical protein